MKVYKFIEPKWAQSVLKNKRIKVSEFHRLNDPFELSAINLRNPGINEFNRKAKDFIGNKYGLISFSSDYRSPLMWGHYAKSHTGICIGFDVADHLLHEVRYSRERLLFEGKTSLDKADVVNLISVKFSEWRYEKEQRILVDLSLALKIGDNYFEKLSQDIIIKEILLGVNCPHSCEEYKKLVSKKFKAHPPIHVRRLSLAKTKFGVTKTQHVKA